MVMLVSLKSGSASAAENAARPARGILGSFEALARLRQAHDVLAWREGLSIGVLVPIGIEVVIVTVTRDRHPDAQRDDGRDRNTGLVPVNTFLRLCALRHHRCKREGQYDCRQRCSGHVVLLLASVCNLIGPQSFRRCQVRAMSAVPLA